MGFEIHDEPEERYSGEVTDWMSQAAEALYEGDAAESERLLKQALEVEPDSPHILNNLGATYARQGRRKEAEAIVQRLYREHPDYFFGIVGRANLHLSQGETEQAKALLQPLMSRGRLHISEFNALAVANIQLSLAEGAPESAQSWLDIWSQVDPDNPDLDYWQRRLKAGKLQLPNLRKLIKFGS
jgi:predicted Zn-dependent protease